MKVAVVGSGYVGLVAGACFADSGNDVWCVDIDEKKINDLKEGIIPIYEPGLETLVKRNHKEERLFFTTDIKEAVEKSRVIFIAVGTPPDEDGSADLRHVLSVARDIAKNMNEYKVIVDKSTVPVGTADKVKEAINEVLDKRFSQNPQSKSQRPDFDVVSNPEFLKEGDAINDFLKPDRVVIGVDNDKAQETMNELYEPFVRTGHPIFFMDVKSAEMTKYAANSMLATRISFMNELALLCEKVGADIEKVRTGIGSDTRIGSSFLFAGCGYGGSCFPKDVKAIIKTAKQNGIDLEVLTSVESVNYKQKRLMFNRVMDFYNKDVNGKTFAIWGLSFKPKTDDMREAPSRVIIKNLLDNGATVRVFDPEAMDEAKRIFKDKKGITYCSSMYEACEGSDAIVLVTEWNEFRRPDFDKVKDLLKEPVVFDGRNQFKVDRMKEKGFKYFSIGRDFLK
ncbi:MAG: UDP-glucose 6-dehydrogenase [Candidatus Muiribacterium halophilum]|uniref:UDP-glucose 6-dehydrogenase n=2 Tax=Muiribacterium halophilum TaxID=2053465 RepID=A0A2N5Z9U9_MUIH1|nr:MAG: UDP-glucose 6-dehydrogenase [Candidatus Muirbacterium halophilum]